MSAWLSFVLFQGVWFAAVLGAAKGEPLLGPASGALLVALALKTTPDLRAELLSILAALCVALILDGGLGGTGWVRYQAHPGPAWLAPSWILALWAGFATTLAPALAWLARRRLLAALLGAVFGPIAYASGQRLGALLVLDPRAYVLLVGGWAAATPGLIALSSWLHPAGAGPDVDAQVAA